MDTADILLPGEAEAYIEHLEFFDLKEIGSQRWSYQHERIEKLNMQAVVSATTQRDEFIKEFFINHDKIKFLIQDLLCTEVWKDKIFSFIMESDFSPKTTFPLYMALYHEAIVANLLETIMYHRDSCESAEDAINDLVDYCYRKLCYLISRDPEEDEIEEAIKGQDPAEASQITSMEELEKQKKKLHFDICIKAISLLRYVSDHLQGLPLSVMSRVLNTHDLPNLMVQLLESPPWSWRLDGKLYKYVDSKWREISVDDQFTLTKTEGQVWITLFHLLMDPSCQEKYDLNSYRKNTILKVRSYLSPVVLDQLPVLGDLQRYLEHLSMMEPPPARKDLVLEQVPEIRDNLLRKYEGKWKKIAKQQMKSVFNPSDTQIREQAKLWANTYNFDVLETLISDPPKCAVCGQEATKRCSRCQNEWYCRRECQVEHWPKHKKACDLLKEASDKLQEQQQQAPIVEAKS
ncbi:zinc finger MYND domain-containing protein 10-like [Babylonia areolata]|uniref:zinc finger MYND domain-containing protein 10-like n=1 Tax=Babylonia areolata TaxID=304850 RepID=UPI003FD27BF2